MVKKLMAFLLILLLPLTALAEGQVIDNANLFTAADVSAMTEIIDRIEKEHQVDIVVLTTYDVPKDYSDSMWHIQAYADDFYDNGNYGMGEDFSGMLILVDMNNRVLYLSTGGVMIDYITDMREEDILDQAYSYLSYGAYGNAMIAALDRVEYYMNKGRAEGTFRYDEVTGLRIGGIYNALTMAEICLAGLAGGIAALLMFLSVSGSYNLAGRTYSYDLNANSDLKLTQDDEVFVRQFQRRTLRNTGGNGSMGGSGGRSGGSGVHRSSSGRMHGGGGRRF
ncbi:MAG: TPM domain-containing protein [Clostridia bacterium]|nr:TPM domain-containing protein [Clostridia bacterium]